jgi:hypothetical protein
LNTDELGIVYQTQEDTELLDRPKVVLLFFSKGEYQKREVVDLREMDEISGEFKRSIVRTLDPNAFQINISEFII